MQLDLVDNLRLQVYLVTVGRGQRLFGETDDITTFEPEGATMLGSVVLLRYRAASPIWRRSARARPFTDSPRRPVDSKETEHDHPLHRTRGTSPR
jgi:hypothetical protein